MSNEIRNVIKLLPVRGLEEIQSGNYIYSSNGEILIGNKYFPVSVKIHLVQKKPWIHISSPKAKMMVSCEFHKMAGKLNGITETN